MPKVLNMPKIGVNMTDAKIIAWAVKEGDTINDGDHILDAETDKAVQEIYTNMSGTIAKILAPAGVDVLCQTPVAILVEQGERLDTEFLKKYTGEALQSVETERKKEEVEKNASTQSVPVVEAEPQAFSVQDAKGRIKISPLARKIAKDMNIPIAELFPAKPGARIVKADVLAYSVRTSTVEVKAAGKIKGTIPYSGIRKIIGQRMTESKNTKPSVALTLHVDMEQMIQWRNRLKKAEKPVSYNDMFVLITARSLREQPIINSKLLTGDIELLNDINIGVAVDTEKGLTVPVIKNADKKGLLEISEEFRSMVESVKSGRASADDLTGGTFTISNLGMFEIEHFTPIINPPECCILGLGSIVREPVAGENDVIEIRSRMQITLVFDHRIVDGAHAARFLQRLKHLAEWPLELMN